VQQKILNCVKFITLAASCTEHIGVPIQKLVHDTDKQTQTMVFTVSARTKHLMGHYVFHFATDEIIRLAPFILEKIARLIPFDRNFHFLVVCSPIVHKRNKIMSEYNRFYPGTVRDLSSDARIEILAECLVRFPSALWRKRIRKS